MTAKTEGVAQRSGVLRDLVRRPEAGALIGTISVFIFFAIFSNKSFLTAAGVSSWLNPASELGIIAVPVGLLMIAGELDVSVGSVVAGSSMTLAIVSGRWGAPIWIGVLAAIGLGLLAGFINGTLVTRTNVPSLIVTLAMLFTMAGLTLGVTKAITGSTSVALRVKSPAKGIFGGVMGGQFQVSLLWWLALILLVAWGLHASIFGNWIFAVGGDKESARTSGVPTSKVKIALYMLTGASASMVGVLQTVFYNGAQVAKGQAYVFNGIVAVVVGGVLLTGGFGSVVGIVLGTLTFSIVSQGIYFTGWQPDWASLILGVLILAAVVTNNSFRRTALRAKSKS
jgi:simple sugar transport system permease protein